MQLHAGQFNHSPFRRGQCRSKGEVSSLLKNKNSCYPRGKWRMRREATSFQTTSVQPYSLIRQYLIELPPSRENRPNREHHNCPLSSNSLVRRGFDSPPQPESSMSGNSRNRLLAGMCSNLPPKEMCPTAS